MINERGTDFQDIHMGAEVFTSDGDRLGEVGDIRGAGFKVNAAMQPDYWLPTSSVTSTTATRVTLSFRRDDLRDYRMDEPLVA